jgi:hypothetical protein
MVVDSRNDTIKIAHILHVDTMSNYQG